MCIYIHTHIYIYIYSFFCGDAAGRLEGDKPWKGTTKKDKSKDFSDSDRRLVEV